MHGSDQLAVWVTSCLLLSLRIAPTFLFAPPFTLMRVPRLVLALLGLGLSAMMIAAQPGAQLGTIDSATIVLGALHELCLGLVPVVVLHGLFGALYLVGRTIDIQSGFGLALLIDPTTRAQTPLVGTLFAYVAGVTFFAMHGQFSVIGFLAESLRVLPVGAPHAMAGISILGAFLTHVTLIALGIGGAAILALFLTDIVIAMLSRTVPQMNALLMGIQVKALLVLAVLPVAFGASASLFARLVSDALSFMPRLV